MNNNTDQLICNCGLRQHIQKMIDRCKVELEAIEKDGQKELKPKTMEDDMWFGMQEERHEYLEGLQSSLQFMLDYPEREQVV